MGGFPSTTDLADGSGGGLRLGGVGLRTQNSRVRELGGKSESIKFSETRSSSARSGRERSGVIVLNCIW